jgi:folylpolyglutamate synthase/dihydropteroate synthase
MDVIGNTLDEIADEKSGIIKQSVPCIIGPTCIERNPIIKRAKELDCNLIKV